MRFPTSDLYKHLLLTFEQSIIGSNTKSYGSAFGDPYSSLVKAGYHVQC